MNDYVAVAVNCCSNTVFCNLIFTASLCYAPPAKHNTTNERGVGSVGLDRGEMGTGSSAERRRSG